MTLDRNRPPDSIFGRAASTADRPHEATASAHASPRPFRAASTKVPLRPCHPASGVRPETLGNGSDFVAQVAGTIISAFGSFDSVTGVTNENINGSPNLFSLQLNTNLFNTSLVQRRPNPVDVPRLAAVPLHEHGPRPRVKLGRGIHTVLAVQLRSAVPDRVGLRRGDELRSQQRQPSAHARPDNADLPRLSLMGKALGGRDTIILDAGGWRSPQRDR
jgi:hypothetical protein